MSPELLRSVPMKRRIAVITPVFRHSGLVIEAIESIRSQTVAGEILHVLVNDGCPFGSTHEICATYATAYPGAILYLQEEWRFRAFLLAISAFATSCDAAKSRCFIFLMPTIAYFRRH